MRLFVSQMPKEDESGFLIEGQTSNQSAYRMVCLLLFSDIWPFETSCSMPGSSVQEIFQVRILEWVAISFSKGFSQSRDWTRAFYIVGGFFTTEPPGKPSANRIHGSKHIINQGHRFDEAESKERKLNAHFTL